jgi:hypothetical protein
VVSDLFKKAKGLFGREAEQKPAPAKKAQTTYHSVSIMPGPRCCAAARDLVGQRFLSREAPPLPLKDCDRPECQCRYEHHQDRRRGPRRARELGVAIDGHDGVDQRGKAKPGRRKTDT